ncbi:translation initiation inhibitor [Actinobacillus equuli]|nr:translation initiation inhibitor [Actinobacillus equuli]
MEIILPNQSKGHYSPAIKSNGMLYVSGQLPFNADGKLLVILPLKPNKLSLI